MKISLIIPFSFSILLSLGLTSCDSGYAESGALSYEEAKITIEQKESIYPEDFLTVDGTYRKNFIGEWVLEGTVASTATVTKYKDVVLNVNYYSKTETLLGTERHVIYDYFIPRSKVEFKFKSFGYKGAEKVGIEFVEATPSN